MPSVLAGWTIGLAVAWAAVQVLTFVTSFEAAEVYSRGIDAGGATAVLTAYDGIGFVFFPIQVATFVVACQWLFRSRELTAVLQPRERHKRRPVWVWLGWVVPVVALWFPFQVVRDIRSGTTGLRRTTGLGSWWASWLVMVWASTQAARSSIGIRPLDPALMPVLEGVAAVAAVIGVVLWIRIVREITAAQRARLEMPPGV
ncbi:DUF4328 domain-containing protein [Isoptericola aurantiacus]|uniref:DUF4328 domain-containing protein n=1 Tax=Isoptericola aurantiacus TaxID=3377839 RepID=UPI00383A782F